VSFIAIGFGLSSPMVVSFEPLYLFFSRASLSAGQAKYRAQGPRHLLLQVFGQIVDQGIALIWTVLVLKEAESSAILRVDSSAGN
jgi:hypothetical protein